MALDHCSSQQICLWPFALAPQSSFGSQKSWNVVAIGDTEDFIDMWVDLAISILLGGEPKVHVLLIRLPGGNHITSTSDVQYTLSFPRACTSSALRVRGQNTFMLKWRVICRAWTLLSMDL